MVIEIVVRIDPEETKIRREFEDGDDREYISNYARFFDEDCAGWTKDSEFNLLYLKERQNYANAILRSRGYVFLNEVYDLLGIQRTKAGQCIGWLYEENNPCGDNYIDFDIFAAHNKDFVNGLTNSPLLDFNVDGVILDKVL